MIITDQDVEVLEGEDRYELSEKGIEVPIDLETDIEGQIEERVHEKIETDKRQALHDITVQLHTPYTIPYRRTQILCLIWIY